MTTWQEYQQARREAVRSQGCPTCEVPPHDACRTYSRFIATADHAARVAAAHSAGVMPAPYGAGCADKQTAAEWAGPECQMCGGTGVARMTPADGIPRYPRCAACNGHGREAS